MVETFSMQLPSDVLALLEVLDKSGYEAYVVGGCVRDACIGRKPHDYDICTSATPSQIKEAFRLAGYKTYDTGIKHGTVSVNNNDELYEITTFRIDGKYSDGRHPDNVMFTKNLKEDLARRDFTINAMAYNYTVGLIDPFGGVNDIENKTIRCVGDPTERFSEDALRMLRAMRLAVVYGFSLETQTFQAMDECKSLLDLVSPERKRQELLQFISVAPASVLDQCKNVLAQVIPEVEPTFEFPEDTYCKIKSLWQMTIETINNLWDDIILRLAALLQNIGRVDTYRVINGVPSFPGYCEKTLDVTDSALRRLKFDNITRRNVLDVLRYQDKPITKDPAILKAVMNKIGEDNTRRLVKLLIANTIAYKTVRVVDGKTKEDIERENDEIDKKIIKLHETEDKISEIILTKECYQLKDLEIKGEDILQIGVQEERDVGIVLNQLLKDVLKHPEHNKKEFLKELAEKEIEKLEISRNADFSLFE